MTRNKVADKFEILREKVEHLYLLISIRDRMVSLKLQMDAEKISTGGIAEQIQCLDTLISEIKTKVYHVMEFIEV